MLLTSHIYVIFLIAQGDKKESGQTISHFIGIFPRNVDYHQGKWTFTVTGYRYTRYESKEGKELEHSQNVIHRVSSHYRCGKKTALRRLYSELEDIIAS